MGKRFPLANILAKKPSLRFRLCRRRENGVWELIRLENIDPLYILQPVVVIAFSVGLVVYWHYKRSFSRSALWYSLGAYAGAIAVKAILQYATYDGFDSAVNGNPAALGVYFGAQTALFEVGGAFLLASIAVSRGRFSAKDAEGYGLGLAFWENAVLLGVPTLLGYIAEYAILSAPSSASAQSLYSTLSTSSPALFYGPLAALTVVGYGIMERVSSLLCHFSWGLLAVMAAVYKRRLFLAVALPIGFVLDFASQFGPYLGTGPFELVVFVISLVSLMATLWVTRSIRREGTEASSSEGPRSV